MDKRTKPSKGLNHRGQVSYEIFNVMYNNSPRNNKICVWQIQVVFPWMVL